MRPLNPVQRFALLSSVCIAGLCLVLGLAIALLLEHHMREVEWRRIAEDVQYQAQEHQFLPYFTDPQRGRGPAEHREAFGRLLHMPEVVRITVWDRQATVLWSSDERLIGKRFSENAEVKEALAGEIAVELKTLHELEQKYGQGPTTTLAEIYVPIRSTTSGEVVGVIELYAHPARLFASIQRMRIIVWAIVLSGGLLLFFGLLPIVRRSHRKQLELEGSLRRTHEGLQAIYHAGLHLQEPLGLQERVDRLVATAQDLLHVDRVCVLLADSERRWLQAIASTGTETALETLRVPIGPDGGGLAQAYLTQQAIIWNNRGPVPEGIRLKSPFDQIAAFRSRIFAIAPLVVGGRAIGVLGVDRKQNRRPLESVTVELLQLFAAQAAIAIENARLHASIVKQSEELQALLRATRTIMAGLDLRETLERIINEAAQISGIRHVKVVLADKEAGVVRVAAAVGRPATMFEGFASPLGTGTSGLVAATGQPLFIADCQNDPRNHLYADQDRKLGIQTYLGLPIKVRDEVLGVLTFNTAEPHQYNADELTYLASFADQGAVAIENARLYQEVQRHASVLEDRVHERTRELEAANQQLQAASRHKSEFLANMSHELRTPLNSVLGFAQLLREQTSELLSVKQTRFLTHIYTSGQHLLQLINDILDLSKVEAGKFVIQPAALPVAATMEDILVIARGLANKKSQRIEATLAPDLPPLHADPVRFKQILFNLLSNAVKFTPDGGTITVRARSVPAIADLRLQIADCPDQSKIANRQSEMLEIAPDCKLQIADIPDKSAIINLQSEMLEIAVTDTGLGIRAEDFPKLFREFTQLETTRAQQHEGSGLGLALTKRLVELHGGRIWAASEGEGRGSTFTVVLPLPTFNG